MQPKPKLPEFKIVFVGEAAVGKTSIIMRYHHDVFNVDAQSTIGSAFISKTINTKHGDAVFHIWDTAGQERYRSLVPMYSRGACSAIIVFDLSDPDSFDQLDSWINRVKQDVSPDCTIIVAGNKCDLSQVVSREDIQKWSDKTHIQVINVSAKTGENIENLFNLIANSLPEAKFRIPNASIPIAEHEETESKGCPC